MFLYTYIYNTYIYSIYTHVPIVLGWIITHVWLVKWSFFNLVAHPWWSWCISGPGELQRTYLISCEWTRSITKYDFLYCFIHKNKWRYPIYIYIDTSVTTSVTFQDQATKNWSEFWVASTAAMSGWRTPECSGSNRNSGGIPGPVGQAVDIGRYNIGGNTDVYN